MHMLAECEAYDAVRRSHADLFSDFGGWMEFPRDLSADHFRAFMHQPAHQVSAFLRECAQRRWANPLLDVLCADELTAEEADVLLGVEDGDLGPKSSDLFLSAISDEFYDVYSDAYYDTGTPRASLAPYGVFRQILNHVTVTVTVSLFLTCSLS
jgi:hypothetical protein